MSKTELLYNKILKVTMFVAVISLILLIIDLFFAVTKQAIDCSGQLCTIDSSETFFRVTIWLLLVFVVIFVVIARIMLFLLTRENKLEDATSYKSRIEEQSSSSDFSESKLYEDIKANKVTGKFKKVKKSKTSPKIGEVFSGAVDSTKDFFTSLKDKYNVNRAERAVKKDAKSAERKIQKEAQAVENKIQREAKAVEKEAQDAERKIQRETKAAEKEAARIEKEERLAAERETARIEKEERLLVEREAERVRLEELAIEDAKRQEEQAIQNAKDKESKEKEAMHILAKLREEEKIASEKAEEEPVQETPKEKEYFTRLNKTELIALVAEASDLSKAKCKLVVNTFIDTIVEELGSGNDVNIVKFGKFRKVTIKETKEVNPKTGKTKVIPEENNVKFLPDKTFKDMITNDIESTSDKNLFTKKVMKEMTEDEVQEQLIKEEKSKEHLETKILQEDVEQPLSKKEIKAKQKQEKRELKEKLKLEKIEAARVLEEKRLEEIAIQEAKDKELREIAEKEQAIQEAKDKKIREKAEKDKAIQDAKDKKIREKAEKEQAAKEAKEKELKEKAEKEQAAKEAKEQELKEKAEKEQAVKDAKEKELKEKEAKEQEIKDKAAAAKIIADAKPTKVAVPIKAAKPAKPKEIKKTKADIIVYIEEQAGISKNKSNKFLKFFAEVVREELAKGKDVNIPGFGLFTTIEMPAKEAVNPQTNKKIVVPAHHQARLRFDDKFKKKFEVK